MERGHSVSELDKIEGQTNPLIVVTTKRMKRGSKSTMSEMKHPTAQEMPTQRDQGTTWGLATWFEKTKMKSRAGVTKIPPKKMAAKNVLLYFSFSGCLK